MLAAVEADDRGALLAALAGTPLLLPVSAAAEAGLEPPGWPTGVQDGRTHVLAFTSPAAIAACLPGRPVSYRVDDLTDLLAAWPDPTWSLAVDPGLPIGVGVRPALRRVLNGVSLSSWSWVISSVQLFYS